VGQKARGSLKGCPTGRLPTRRRPHEENQHGQECLYY